MKSRNSENVPGKYEYIRSILKSLEKDSIDQSYEYDNFREIFKKYYVENLNFSNCAEMNFTASTFINENKYALEKIQKIEKLENQIFNATSNAAIWSTVGAAVFASLAPTFVGPVVVFAAATAIVGYLGKLKLDSDAENEARSLMGKLEEIEMKEIRIEAVRIENYGKESKKNQARG
ncbi:hypothetical protein [Microbulbifer sp. PAAF003]|uniref:hypothetical protein n=1 Tax=Microbulbifer sp. PAAF003 TaxID=3243375 RepID=UPI004039F904